MDLRQLTYFQMICRFRSFTKTAEYFNISQPSITVAVQKLEEELGVKLLERSQKKIRVTTAGEIFLQRVDVILNTIENAVAEMHDYGTTIKEVIRVGIPPMIGSYLLPYMFTEYKTQHPNVELIIQELGSTEIHALLESNELDIGLVILREPSPILEIEQTKDGEILIILTSQHPLSSLPAIPFSLLENERFILAREGTNIREIILDTCLKHDFIPNVVQTSSQISTLFNLVSAGIGISFALDVIVPKNENIVGRSLINPLYIKTGVVWRKDKFLSVATQDLIHFIKKKSEIDK